MKSLLLWRWWCWLKEGEGKREGGECPLRWRAWPGLSSGNMLSLLLMLLLIVSLLASRERARSSGMKLSEMEEEALWCWLLLLLLLMLVREGAREREGGEKIVKAEEEGGRRGWRGGQARRDDGSGAGRHGRGIWP